MSPETESILTALFTVALSGAVALGLYKLFRPRGPATTAGAFGRRWMAWAIAIGTITVLPPFFRKLDGNSLALWLLSVVLSGGLTFLIGWVVGLFRFQRTERHLASQPRHFTPTAASAPTARGSDQVFDDTVATNAAGRPPVMHHLHYRGENHGPYLIDQIKTMWASGVITADAVYWSDVAQAWKPITGCGPS